MDSIVPPEAGKQDGDDYTDHLLAALSDVTATLERIQSERSAVATLAATNIAGRFATSGDEVWLRYQCALFKDAYGSGAMKFWHLAGLPHYNALNSPSRLYRREPNDGVGRWFGIWPLEEGHHMPPNKTPIVYHLYSGEELIYIGSTLNFASRIHQHSRDKQFNRWRARSCASDRACRDLEAVLIDKHRPPLNRVIPKPRVGMVVDD